jgi:hypothetical protein
VLAHVPHSRLRRLSVLRSARTCELLVEDGTLSLDSGWDGKGLPSENLRGTELAHVSGLNNFSTTLARTPDIVPGKRSQDAVCAEPGIDAFLANIGNVSASWCNCRKIR